MKKLTDKQVVIIGGTGSVGQEIVAACVGEGAHVTAIARQELPLKNLRDLFPAIKTMALDFTEDTASARLFEQVKPDIVVIASGVIPPNGPIHDLSWAQFSLNWEGDVRATFNLCKGALTLPLASGTQIIIMSSGAGLVGSPVSGGYASAKKGQMFIASYSQKESDRLNLGLRFVSLAPRMMPDTKLGQGAVAGYADYHGISEAEFLTRMGTVATPQNVVAAVLAIAAGESGTDGPLYSVSEMGMEAVI